MLTALQFYQSICEHLKKHSRIARGFHMHEPKERWRQNRPYHPQRGREVTYRGRTLAVQVFCDPKTGKGNLYVQVLSRPRGKSTNTQHVTLTNRNIAEDCYFVQPSLARCRGRRFNKQPRKIGKFPALKVGSRNHYLVGPMGNKLLARVFEVAFAKYQSI
jgi:hypothetical protein